MREWQFQSLKSLTVKIGSGATPRGGENSYKNEGISLIRSQNVLDFQLNLNGVAFIDEQQAEELKNVEVLREDILLNITGDSVARCCIFDRENLSARVNQHVAIVRVDKNISDYRFIFYFLQKNKDELLSLSEIGATRRALTKGMIEHLEVPCPPLHEQKAIASVLSSLDDKIDLLHRQNKTLEAMAEALFRQWFVEEAGDDWEEKSLYDCIELVGGGTPKTSVDEYWNGNVYWISAKDITPNHKGVILSTEKTITNEGLNNSSAKILPQFSTVISARGTVGKYALLFDDMAFSQSNYGIVPKYKKCYFFNYLLVAAVVDDLVGAAYGSVFDTITTKTFKEHYVTVPSENEIMKFEKEVSPLFWKVLNNSGQIRTLEKLRDTLLPKLMSGEVRVAC